jgi:hypothetical protein
MGIPYQIVKPGLIAWLTGWKSESGRTGREHTVRLRHLMQMLLSATTILVLFAWAREEVAKLPSGSSPFDKIEAAVAP